MTNQTKKIIWKDAEVQVYFIIRNVKEDGKIESREEFEARRKLTVAYSK